jgi:hypothetical protein
VCPHRQCLAVAVGLNGKAVKHRGRLPKIPVILAHVILRKKIIVVSVIFFKNTNTEPRGNLALFEPDIELLLP